MERILDGKVALVTGAGSGIGRAVAVLYADAGARVVVSDLDDMGGEETVAAIAEKGGTARYVHADVGTPEGNERLVARTLELFGALHAACNNAGIGGPSAPVGEYPLDGWEKVLRVNLSGPFWGMRHQLPALLASGGGAIVNMASILGQVGWANSCAYVAAKHGLVGLTKNAALEYAPRGIRANVVGPGFIRTPLLEKNLDEATLAGLASLHPVGRIGEAREVAELVVFLSSERASFVTGAYVAVDGGYLAR